MSAPATRLVRRHAYGSHDDLLAAVRELAMRGEVVRVYRYGGPSPYELVYNDPLFLVREAHGPAIGSFETVFQAVAAGDAYVEAMTCERPG